MKKIALLLICLMMSFGIRALDTPPLEEQGQSEETPEKPTFTKRLEYFGTGLAYGLIVVASLMGAYRCTRLSLDKANDDDPVKEWHDLYDELGEPKEGADWNKHIKEAWLRKIFYKTSSVVYGSLALGLPFLNYKYKIPHKACENFKKAFQ